MVLPPPPSDFVAPPGPLGGLAHPLLLGSMFSGGGHPPANSIINNAYPNSLSLSQHNGVPHEHIKDVAFRSSHDE